MSVLINGTNGLIQAYDYQVLTTGFSYTFSAGTQALVINPAGTLAAGTITMPASPSDGMTITFSSTKQITAVTLNGNTGQTVVGGVTLLPANQAAVYVYRATNTSWFPLSTIPTNVPVTPAGGSIITSGTAVASTSGTSIDFTSIPSWVKRVTVGFYGVSTNGSSAVLFQLGSGSAQATGYLAAYGYLTASNSNASTQSVGFPIWPVGGAAGVTYGQIQFCCMNPSTYIWTAQGQFMQSGQNYCMVTSGAVTLTGALDRVRITSISSDTFDAGSINIIYE